MNATRAAGIGIFVWYAVVGLGAPALASTMPGADDTGARVGVGLGPGGLAASYDMDAAPNLRLGASLGTGYPLGVLSSIDVRGAYRLPGVGVPKLTLAVLGGVSGMLGTNGAAFGAPGLGLELGVGGAYALTPKWEARVNLVYALPFVGNYDWWGAPMSGAEIGYKFTPKLEGTLGWTGRYETLGLRFGL